MNVYVAMSNPWGGNEYVSTLIEEIAKNEDDVCFFWGISMFWNDALMRKCDIIHIQWPSYLLYEETGVVHDSKEVCDRLKHLKRLGKKIVTTCHNLEPHYCKSEEEKKCYCIAYENSNMILHLGEWSKDQFDSLYPNASNVLLLHHVYDTVYEAFPNKKESREYLGWDDNSQYILCFGAFRDDEERRFLIEVSKHFKREKVFFVAPSFSEMPWGGLVNNYKRRIKKFALRKLNHIIVTGHEFGVRKKDVPYYYGGADAAFVFRKKVLNSGTIPLAFLMGKVVVGPDMGNVGCLLKSLKNPVYSVNDTESVVAAIKSGLELSKSTLGQENKQYALEHMSTKQIARQLFDYYHFLEKCNPNTPL